jgi:hypothetical protein
MLGQHVADLVQRRGQSGLPNYEGRPVRALPIEKTSGGKRRRKNILGLNIQSDSLKASLLVTGRKTVKRELLVRTRKGVFSAFNFSTNSTAPGIVRLPRMRTPSISLRYAFDIMPPVVG